MSFTLTTDWGETGGSFGTGSGFSDEIIIKIYTPVRKEILKSYQNMCTSCEMAYGVARNPSLKSGGLLPPAGPYASKSITYTVQPYARHVGSS